MKKLVIAACLLILFMTTTRATNTDSALVVLLTKHSLLIDLIKNSSHTPVEITTAIVYGDSQSMAIALNTSISDVMSISSAVNSAIVYLGNLYGNPSTSSCSNIS